jgi:hypothetical protein
MHRRGRRCPLDRRPSILAPCDGELCPQEFKLFQAALAATPKGRWVKVFSRSASLALGSRLDCPRPRSET